MGGLKETWDLLTIFLENDGWILNSKRWGQKEEGTDASCLGLFLLLACGRSAENWRGAM